MKYSWLWWSSGDSLHMSLVTMLLVRQSHWYWYCCWVQLTNLLQNQFDGKCLLCPATTEFDSPQQQPEKDRMSIFDVETDQFWIWCWSCVMSAVACNLTPWLLHHTLRPSWTLLITLPTSLSWSIWRESSAPETSPRELESCKSWCGQRRRQTPTDWFLSCINCDNLKHGILILSFEIADIASPPSSLSTEMIINI